LINSERREDVPSLQDLYNEVHNRKEESPEDSVLRKYLKRLNKRTGRETIFYASAFTEKEAAGRVLQINREDCSCFMTASAGLDSRELDLVLHSPGGTVEATEQVVSYLRRRYDHIRVIVPLCVLSTATLLCCAADRILMAEHAVLSPIDPVINWSHQGSTYSALAQNLINEYSIAQRTIRKNRDNAGLWLERLKAYPPGLLAACVAQAELSRTLARAWLQDYMFRGEEEAAARAESVSAWLADSRDFVGGLRPIGHSQASSTGLKVELLNEDEALLDDVMAVYYAGVTKFQGGDCVKIIENHAGKGCMIGVSAPATLARES
jgi:ATP-dependent protease ClpP protease subunit